MYFVTQFTTNDYEEPEQNKDIHHIYQPNYRVDAKLDPDLEDQINRPLTKEDFAGEYRPLTIAPLVWADPNNSETPQADYVAEHILKMQKQK